MFTDGHECGNSREIWANAQIFQGRGRAQRNGDGRSSKSDTLGSTFDEKVTASDVDRWFEVENDDGVRAASISYIVDEIEDLTIETREKEAEENEAEDEGSEVTASPPSLQQVYAMFRSIQESAFLCNLPDASNYLHITVQLFREAIRKLNPPTQRELLITEMLTKRS